MPAGRFIVFEGIDGSGLSTQAALLAEWLLGKGHPVYLTKEPSAGPAGSQIRLALAGRLVSRPGPGAPAGLDPRAMALLFAADRMDHLAGEIEPLLEAGTHVVCDRYVLSSLAYQGAEVDPAWVQAINAGARPADLTVLLRVPPQVALARIRRARPRAELYENGERLGRVLDNYERLARELAGSGQRIAVLDGTLPVDAVHREVVSLVAPLVTPPA